MLIYNNNVIITPVRTGTNTLHNMLFQLGAVTIFVDPAILNYDFKTQVNPFYQQDIDKQHTDYLYRSDPHYAGHSVISVLNKKVFLSVRNPYDRLISFYWFFVNPETAMPNPWSKKAEHEQWKSFSDFVLAIKDPISFNLSLLHEYNFIKADDFLRIEFLSQDLKKIGIVLEADQIAWFHKNHKKPSELKLQDYYTKEVLEKANTWCKAEAEFFGYPTLKWNHKKNRLEKEH